MERPMKNYSKIAHKRSKLIFNTSFLGSLSLNSSELLRISILHLIFFLLV